MRDFVSCFSENAVNISHPSCSNYSNAAVVSPPPPSVQTAVTSLYATTLSAAQTISITWAKTHSAQSLTVNFNHPSAISFKLDTSAARFFKKNRGSKSYDSHSSKIEILWDLSTAQYDVGPEPISGFYVLITVDSEIALVLGEIPTSFRAPSLKSAMAADPEARKSSLVSRTEHCFGNTLFSTKAKFCENGVSHEILIKCSGDEEGAKKKRQQQQQQPGLWVWIDKKAVIRVKRLEWNFRGNQSIFVDGFLVDLLWDVHDWFFGSAINGFAVFMFRRRSGLETRLWLEEEKLPIEKDNKKNVDFSLLIYASKISS